MFLVFLIMAPPQKLVLAPGDTIKETIRFRFLYEYNGSIVGGNLVQQVWLCLHFKVTNTIFIKR